MAYKQSDDYFKLFLGAVDYSRQAAGYLRRSLERYDHARLGAEMDEIHVIEHAGDELRHLITRKLVRDFITPIEREDIIALSERIDDVTDATEDILQKLYMFHIKAIQPEALEFADILQQCCEELYHVFEEFHNFKKSATIMKSIIELNRLEEVGDRLYIQAMYNLYGSCADPVLITAWAAVYDQFEKCCDTCEMTANLVEEVIMKNS